MGISKQPKLKTWRVRRIVEEIYVVTGYTKAEAMNDFSDPVMVTVIKETAKIEKDQ